MLQAEVCDDPPQNPSMGSEVVDSDAGSKAASTSTSKISGLPLPAISVGFGRTASKESVVLRYTSSAWDWDFGVQATFFLLLQINLELEFSASTRTLQMGPGMMGS